MRKIIVFNMVTVDGYFAGSDGNIDWHMVDSEFNDFAIKQTAEFGTLIFGKTTYDLMKSYWPTEAALKDDPTVAKLMNETPKIVFSKSLKSATWENTVLMDEIDTNAIRKLKEEKDKDIAIFGSGEIVQQFANLDLIDEYRLMVNPVILGEGKLLFKGVKKTNLNLVNSRTFGNGNILLYYQPK
ncbi:MAG TPA: dihydrofolate reductase family protein [Patescibacteria group bacterium]|nr:dihydrofolate reductase family protein [Patescibacteria group bacterium]